MIKNTGSQNIGAQMTTAADGTIFAGAVTVYVTGDAGTQAIGSVGSGVCTSEGNGYYTYAPAQAETNYSLIGFTFIGTGAISATVQVYTQIVQQTADNDTKLTTIATDVAGLDGDAMYSSVMRGTDGANTTVPDAAGTAAVPGDAMNLAADAIKAVSYDESTAFPLTAVNGSTLTEAGGTGDQLTAINLPNQTMDIVGDITGNLSGSVGSVAANGITATSLATDSINAASVKADAVTKIQSGLAPASEYDTEMARITADVATEAKQDIMQGNVTDILADTNELQADDVPGLIGALNDFDPDAAIPSTPTADSINEYIQSMKYVMLNKTTITKATGTSVILKDNDSTIYATVVGAYVEDPTTVVRLRLE